MDNSKRNVHNSGPLGILMKSGQIKKIDTPQREDLIEKPDESSGFKSNNSYFKTQSGIEFSDQELVYVDPKECEPWLYANRQDDELGDIEELVESIKTNKQLQPALIRNHLSPHDGIKYEIIFGRRRHIACLKLGIPFLAIKKNLPNAQDAIVSQDAENKLRNDVSDYSNALLYKRLLEDKVFKTEKELGEKLRLSPATFNNLMAYAKIPQDIIKKIPNIHSLSKQMAVRLVQILNKSKDNYNKILSISDQLGVTITSQTKLDQVIDKIHKPSNKVKVPIVSKAYFSSSGDKMFTLKSDTRGLPSIVLNKKIAGIINIEDVCDHLFSYLEKEVRNSDIRIEE